MRAGLRDKKISPERDSVDRERETETERQTETETER